MEKDIALGTVGLLKLTLGGGKAVVSVSASESALSNAVNVQASASATVDAGALVDLLFAAIEAASPAGIQPIEATVQLIVKQAVLAIQ